MSGVNVPLLRKAVEWAEAEAAKPPIECRWNQGEWVTDPVARAWELAALELDPSEAGDEYQALVEELRPKCGTCYCIAGYVGMQLDERFEKKWEFRDESGRLMHVEDFAQDALGLDNAQAWVLFRASNTIEDVRRIAEEIAGERL